MVEGQDTGDGESGGRRMAEGGLSLYQLQQGKLGLFNCGWCTGLVGCGWGARERFAAGGVNRARRYGQSNHPN